MLLKWAIFVAAQIVGWTLGTSPTTTQGNESCDEPEKAVRGSLAQGERALQRSDFKAALEAYEAALSLLKEHALWINTGAETQLYNNAGWAAMQLGLYDLALERFDAAAKSCDKNDDDDCGRKVYENLHELVHTTLHRREAAVEWMRRGLASSERTDLAGAEAIDVGDVVRVRLGYLLVLEDRLTEAEAVLRPLLEAYVNATFLGKQTDKNSSSVDVSRGNRRRSLVQETATYVAWSRAFQRDWHGASDAFAIAAAAAVPMTGQRCNHGSWRLREGWFEGGKFVRIPANEEIGSAGPKKMTTSLEGDNWRVYALPVSAPPPFSGTPPWCRGRRGPVGKDQEDCGPLHDDRDYWRAWTDVPSANVKLVELNDAYLGGEDASVLWQPPPNCFVFVGDRAVASSLPREWGVQKVNDGFKKDIFSMAPNYDERMFLGQEDATNSTVIDAAIVLVDARGGHKMFWHHQTETVTRLAVVLARLFGSGSGSSLEPASDLPDRARRGLRRSVLLYPPTLGPTMTAFVNRGHAVAAALNASGRLYPYDWRPGHVVRIKKAFFLDWIWNGDGANSDVPIKWQLRQKEEKGDWLAKLAMTIPGTHNLRRYETSVFRINFVPAALLRLQAAVLRQAFAPPRIWGIQKADKTKVLVYSRADTDKRHVVSEQALVAALQAKWGDRVDVSLWRGGGAPDIERAARDWSRAALVIGPHGAGLANFVHCAPGTPILVLPAKDAVGTPSASDEYFSFASWALDLRLSFIDLAQPPPMFFNYSAFTDADLHYIVTLADSMLFPPDPSANFVSQMYPERHPDFPSSSSSNGDDAGPSSSVVGSSSESHLASVADGDILSSI